MLHFNQIKVTIKCRILWLRPVLLKPFARAGEGFRRAIRNFVLLKSCLANVRQGWRKIILEQPGEESCLNTIFLLSNYKLVTYLCMIGCRNHIEIIKYLKIIICYEITYIRIFFKTFDVPVESSRHQLYSYHPTPTPHPRDDLFRFRLLLFWL